ncbi:hypothetical protein VTJ83DRAFT_5747 [Remersonia thermophila]|uniref:Uncharacterized protein n=1 Tax=Remersonia thermophila TaxID=72144 RepID=A0ABR4D7Q0_9PEZI
MNLFPIAALAGRLGGALGVAREQHVLAGSTRGNALLPSRLSPTGPAHPPQQYPVVDVNITIHQTNVSLLPSPLPPAGPASHADEIIDQFLRLTRSTSWKLVEKVPFEGDTFEPEGLVRFGNGERYLVSAGEWTAPRPRCAVSTQTPQEAPRKATEVGGNCMSAGAGAGIPHLLVFDRQGARVADMTLVHPPGEDAEYHPGGIDYDGTYVWLPLAQYRPASTATVLRLRVKTSQDEFPQVEPVLRVEEHIGAVAHDTSADQKLLGLTWGGRAALSWRLQRRRWWCPWCRRAFSPPPVFTRPDRTVRNPSHFVDYQDCKFLGRSWRHGLRPVMLCSGIASLEDMNGGGEDGGTKTEIGGVALVDMESMIPLWEVPLTMRTDRGALMTKNPMDVAVVNARMRLYFLPDERNSTLYGYEPVLERSE